MKRCLIALTLGLALLSCDVSNPVAPPDSSRGDGSGGGGGAGAGEPNFTITITITGLDQAELEVGADAVNIRVVVTQAQGVSPVGLTYSISTSLGTLLDLDDGTFKQLIEGVLQGTGTDAVLVTQFKPGDQAGTADVLVNVGNTVGTAQFQIIVPVPAVPPMADFAVEQSDLRVLFTSLAQGDGPFSHQWDFGDGCRWVPGTDAGEDALPIGACEIEEGASSPPAQCKDCDISDPVHDYSAPDAYPVKLVLENQKGDKDDKTQLIEVGTLPTPDESPVAMFTAEVQPGGLEVIFRDASTGPPRTWSWNFGDPTSASNTSSQQNPVHTYTSAGEKRVTLTVTNNAPTENSNTTSNFVPVGADIPQLKADFTFVVSESGLIVTFTDASVGEPASYAWNFGDPTRPNNTSTEQNPIHEYVVADEYQVTLTVTDAGGATSTARKLVAAGAPPPKADFTFSCNLTDPDTGMPTTICQGLTVVFNDTSSGDPTSWTWNFDDGTPEETCSGMDTSCRNPRHEYLVSGSYGVKLVVSNTGGSDNITKLVEVDSGETQPDARFTFIKLGGLTVDFRDQSLGNPTKYDWNFNDPDSGADNTSENANPIHTFSAPGDYNVVLMVSNGEGDSSTSQFVRFSTPEADFGFTQVNQEAFFTDQSTGGPVKWEWDFGDGQMVSCTSPDTSCQNPSHQYPTAGGSFDVMLKITTDAPDNLTDQVTKTITINP